MVQNFAEENTKKNVFIYMFFGLPATHYFFILGTISAEPGWESRSISQLDEKCTFVAVANLASHK